MCKFRDFEKYEIYEDGRIWSYKTNRFLKPGTDKVGYKLVVLSDNEGNAKTYRLHRVVYEAVSGAPIPECFEVNHIDEDKSNNSFSNLNIMTHKENCNWGTGIERFTKALTNKPKISKAVGAFQNGKLVMTFPSTMEAERQGFSQGNIWLCCNGKRKTHKGYTWKYL